MSCFVTGFPLYLTREQLQDLFSRWKWDITFVSIHFIISIIALSEKISWFFFLQVFKVATLPGTLVPFHTLLSTVTQAALTCISIFKRPFSFLFLIFFLFWLGGVYLHNKETIWPEAKQNFYLSPNKDHLRFSIFKNSEIGEIILLSLPLAGFSLKILWSQWNLAQYFIVCETWCCEFPANSFQHIFFEYFLNTFVWDN